MGVKSAKRMWVRARKLSPDTEARFRSYEQIGGRSGYSASNYGHHSLWQCNLRNELMRSSHALDEEDLILPIGTFSVFRLGLLVTYSVPVICCHLDVTVEKV